MRQHAEIDVYMRPGSVSATPPTSSSTRMSSAVARAMSVRRRGFIGVPGRDSPFSNFW